MSVSVMDVSKQEWETQDLLEDCTNYAQKADILRLELVYLYGGIYVDMDTTAVRPFGTLCRVFQFPTAPKPPLKNIFI